MLVETEAIGESGLSMKLGPVEATEGQVTAYLRAVSNDLPAYAETGLAPPLYFAAASVGRLLRELALPAGTVHSLQETEVLSPVAIGQELRLTASLDWPRVRAGLKFLTATCGFHTPGGQTAVAAKSTIMLVGEADSGEPKQGRQATPPAGSDPKASEQEASEQEASELPVVARTITQEQLTAYALASGDDNPLHLDAGFAATTQFRGIIAHGMLTLAFVDQMLTAAFGRRWLEEGALRVRFKGAAYLGDRVESWGRASKNGSFAVGVRNSVTGQELVSGTASLINS